MMKYVGVDGCKGGGLAVWVINGVWSFALYDEFVALWDKHKDAEAVLVESLLDFLKQERERPMF
ncbi:hypothetical protein SYK_22210 [Pseudodesulfovibrio nedwellii]|uniref:Uncharacterized protein n=1 Tax=Pseudodesulfovibrio nedwellii TaxID=2973072 RepID=A0ABM8B232_9BACT|nr:DUF429 domain-containing protein [Pseudodesulfovibrio nedwellii]BDQ37861.1 hypothetical protein SYK_22210 [Pseudodesulfovibrio nedwellii]